MCKQLKINRAFNNFLIETFEFTDEQLEAIDYQIPMTQEIYNSILDRCMELGSIADDLLYRLLNEYPEYLSVHGQIIENEVKEKYKTMQRYQNVLDVTASRVVPAWLSADHEALKGTVVAKPKREDIDVPVEETLIVELYSK